MATSEQIESPATINISKIGTEDWNSVPTDLEQQSFSQSSSFGFRSVDKENEIISAELITSTNTRITRYDPEREDIVEETITSTEEISFRINQNSELLEVYSNKDDNGEVINRLGQTIDRVTISDLNIYLEDIVEQLKSHEVDFEISALRINNISPEPNTNGNCYLNTHTDSVAEKLISEYEDDVTYLCIEISLDSEEATIGFYRSGSVRIFSNVNEDEKLFSIVRAAISGVNQHA
ncbi:hypothetical protein [Halorubrum sp. AS12]|uniref:hypothetical protein n=1 Tax=Halorubrum sp. AS12 TaxID=3409687 RepID=UPI003DA74E88